MQPRNDADALTADARKAERARRDAEIAAKAAAGKSNRQVAHETGTSEPTVRRAGASEKRTAEMTPPPGRPVWQQKVDELETPEARAWGSALAALRKVCCAASTQSAMPQI